jgi:hypothetical protein
MADTSVFSRLKRLFSTNTIVRNIGGKKLKIADTDQIQSFVNRRGIDRFHRVYNSATGGYGSSHGRYEAAAAFQGARLQLFRDYDMMDNDPIISSVMDIYADESTIKDEFGKILTIKTNNTQIQEVLENLFYDILNIEFNLWPWTRNMCKYGDFFLYLDIDSEYGIVNAIPLSVYETIRIEGEEPGNPFSVRFEIQNDFLQIGKKDFDNYEVAHFRLLADTNFLPYGKSMVEGGRRVWKQLQLMEDAMLVHRIMRAPDKRKFKIDIGNIPPAEVENYMQRMIERMKKTPLIDPKTGDYNLRYNMMNITEDFYLPVRGRDSGTEIETMQGLQFNAIEDIEYLRNKLMAAFKVPKAFLGYEEDLSGKATLAAQDVRFARTIERVQRIIVSELMKIAIIHLYVQGFRDEELVNFELSLANSSTLYEQEKITIWKERFAIAQQMTGGQASLLSQDWVYKNIFEMSDDQIEEQRNMILEDMKRSQEQMAASQPPMPGMPPGGMGGPPTEGPPMDGGVGGEELPPPGEPPMEPPPEGEPGDADAGAEAQIDDVDEILDRLSDMEFDEEDESVFSDELAPGEDDEELKELASKKKVGRPPEGIKFGTDDHHLGRDPLGHKENQKTYKRRGLSFETKNILDQMDIDKLSSVTKLDKKIII